MGVDPSQADAVSSTSSPPPRTPTLPRQQGRADRPGRDRLFLTLIGGGVFANDMGWIYGAIRVRGLRPPRGRAGGGSSPGFSYLQARGHPSATQPELQL